MKLNNTDAPVKQSGKRLNVKSLLVKFNKGKSYCHCAFNSFDYQIYIFYYYLYKVSQLRFYI